MDAIIRINHSWRTLKYLMLFFPDSIWSSLWLISLILNEIKNFQNISWTFITKTAKKQIKFNQRLIWTLCLTIHPWMNNMYEIQKSMGKPTHYNKWGSICHLLSQQFIQLYPDKLLILSNLFTLCSVKVVPAILFKLLRGSLIL